ncbi:MAG: NAD(P)-dependent oxidoreductase [Cyanobacteria bacterium P01_F01_bin.86]
MIDVLVSGASGFVGKHLINSLNKSSKFEVLGFTREYGDVSERSSWQQLPVAKTVVHLASRTFVPESWKDPHGFYSTNVNGTINALEYCRENNAELIFTSSYLYGVPDKLPIDEDAELKAANPYMFSKKMAEEACRFYSQEFNVPVIILRPFNVYGLGHNSTFLIPTIVDQIIDTDDVIVNDLEPKRDYIFIEDLVAAIGCAIVSKKRSGTYNIATGNSYSVAEIIEIAQTLIGKQVKVTSRNERRPNEIMDTIADITKAKEELSWSPKWSLEDGIKAILNDRMSNA